MTLKAKYKLRTCQRGCILFFTSSLALLSSASRMARRVSSCWARWLSSVLLLVREASFSLRERTCCCSSSSRCSNSFLRVNRKSRNVDHGTITTTGTEWKWEVSAAPACVWPGDVLLMLPGSQGWQGVRQVPAVPLQAAALPGPSFLHTQLVLGTFQLLLQLQHLPSQQRLMIDSVTLHEICRARKGIIWGETFTISQLLLPRDWKPHLLRAQNVGFSDNDWRVDPQG